MTARWETIERIFHAALEKPAGEREAFVRKQADDDQLAAEVLALLAAESGDSVPPRPTHLPGLMEALDAAFLSGRTIGSYQIGELIGEGGMGLVYRAVDQRDSSTVAIKVLPPDQARYPRRVARFLREARALAAVRHPSIVAIRDAGADQGVHYLVMDLLAGETLRQRVARAGPLTLAEAIDAGRAMAAALAAAHAAGVTHRDLKPENVMLTAEGLKVFDFGLAHLDEGEDAQRTTLENALAGTVSYLAPEQIEGSAGTAQSDIFAMGVVLYEAASGAPLFQRVNAIATARAILEETPDYTRVPEALRPVLQRCLAKNPQRRYTSAGEVETELAGAIGRKPRRRIGRWVVALAVLAVVFGAWRLLRGPYWSMPSQTVTVPATTDIWLSGQPDGATLVGNYGTDRAPAQSPVMVRVTAGHTLIFAAAGRTSVDGFCFEDTPDGGCYADESSFGAGPANGISTISVPAGALIGVFVDDTVPSGEAPPRSHFLGPETGFASLAPPLRQVFFIGDGRTGTGQGPRQRFLVPAGATRLFLAVSDSLGGSAPDNLGKLIVTVTDVIPPH